MAAKPANAKGRSRASTRQRSRAPASGIKAAVRKSPQLAAKPTRGDKSALRRDAILAAALEEFSARGFAAARLEDVAQRAGVGKGTIYLHFQDKQALFQELVTTMLVPFIANIEAAPSVGLPIRVVLERLIDLFVREIYGTERRKLIRPIMTEGPPSPQLAEFNYHHVVKRAVPAMRALREAPHGRGQLRNDPLMRFPPLAVPAGLLSVFVVGGFLSLGSLLV